MQVYVTDAQYVWRGLADGNLPETSPALPFFHNELGKDEYCGISRVDMQYNRFCRAHFDYHAWKEKYG